MVHDFNLHSEFLIVTRHDIIGLKKMMIIDRYYFHKFSDFHTERTTILSQEDPRIRSRDEGRSGEQNGGKDVGKSAPVQW